MPARFLMFLLLICSLASGCVVVRGGANGMVVDAATGQPLEGIEVYYYARRTATWPGQEPFSKVMDTQVDRTNRYGDFSIARNWFWLMPFFHRIDEERIVLNLSMPPNLLYRTFADAEYAQYWTRPAFLELIDKRYQGAVIDLHKAQPNERQLSGTRQIGTVPGKFIRLRANQPNLGAIRIERNDEGGGDYYSSTVSTPNEGQIPGVPPIPTMGTFNIAPNAPPPDQQDVPIMHAPQGGIAPAP